MTTERCPVVGRSSASRRSVLRDARESVSGAGSSSLAFCWPHSCRSAFSKATTARSLAIVTAIAAELVMGRITYRHWPAPGQRVYHRYQRRHSGAVAILLAVCAGQL